MTKLNVQCENCNKGNLCLPDGYDGLADYYTIHCTNCSNVFRVHYTGMDCILGSHDYNTQIGEDVKVLKANGSFWGNGKLTIKNKEQFDAEVKGWKHIQTIEADLTFHYYQLGASFKMIETMPYGHSSVNMYKAKDDASVINLMKHFFQTA